MRASPRSSTVTRGQRAKAAKKLRCPPPDAQTLRSRSLSRFDVDPTPVDGLTDRELEVLYCIAWGMMNLEIGSILGISSRTVEIHRAKMIAKLNARTSSEAVRIVMTSGFSLNLDDI